MILEAKNIHKNYGKLHILKGISLSVKKGEVVSIVGASGAGKSTLLHILGALDRADQGEVWINSKRIDQLSQRQMSAFRNEYIGFVFQFHHLLPEFTALENVCIPAYIKGVSKKKAQIQAMEMLDLLGVSSRAHHKPSALSGGEIGRASCRERV